MNSIITANELKTKGVVAIDEAISKGTEAIITVRGKEKFVVVTMEKYDYLRECELEAALLETKRDLAEGRVIEESVEEHLARIMSG